MSLGEVKFGATGEREEGEPFRICDSPMLSIQLVRSGLCLDALLHWPCFSFSTNVSHCFCIFKSFVQFFGFFGVGS